MRLIPNDVATLALGLACSAGQFLLSAGTKGKRRALPHARILMHQGSSGIGGSTVEVEVQAGDLRHMRDTVLGLIADDTGPAGGAHLRGLAARPLVHRAEAEAYGFIDGIVTDFAQVVPRRRRPAGWGWARRRWRHERLHDPERGVAASARRPHHGRLLAPADRAGRLPRHRHRRGCRECAHRPAAAPGCRQPRP